MYADQHAALLNSFAAWENLTTAIAKATGWSALLVDQSGNALLAAGDLYAPDSCLDARLLPLVISAAKTRQTLRLSADDGGGCVCLFDPADQTPENCLLLLLASCADGADISDSEIDRAWNVRDAVISSFVSAYGLAQRDFSKLSEQQSRRNSFLAQLGRLLNAPLSETQVLNTLVSAATSVVSDACAVYTRQKDDRPLSLVACSSARGDTAHLRAILEREDLKLSDHPCGVAALQGRRLIGYVAEQETDKLLTALGASGYLAAPLMAQGYVMGAVVFLQFDAAAIFKDEDIALAEEMMDRVGPALANAQLYEAQERAQEFKDDFLSSVSHELRTPLTAILGYSQLIRKSLNGSGGRMSEQMNIIWSQAQRLNRLVETVLDVSSIEQGQLALNRELVDLEKVLHTALEKIKATAPPEIAFEVYTEPGWYLLEADPLRLEQVFAHLLTNAVKHTQREGPVTALLSKRGHVVIVEISDSGSGIDVADLNQVFGRYYKGDTPVSRSGGLGLGLYVSRGIIEAHGGMISVRSSAGEGASFRVQLPLAAAVDQQAENPKRNTAPGE